ncbi:hypothetical protein, partial [Vibrio sp. HA2012]|uniref:hypothetical protein n=1 Tax=Vibrio sp. HA2012 TaxID=1971595 RepID=UPI001E4DE48D
ILHQRKPNAAIKTSLENHLKNGLRHALNQKESPPHNAQLNGKNQTHSLNRTSHNLKNEPNQKWHVFLSF